MDRYHDHGRRRSLTGSRSSHLAKLVVILATLFVLASCGSDSAEVSDEADPESDEGVELFPDVVGVDAVQDDDGTWTFSVTLSSPYDTPQRYADAWRVSGRDGEVYGIRELTHDHQAEQPFTRSHSGIAIPDDVSSVVIEGRDQISGWGGATIDFQLP